MRTRIRNNSITRAPQKDIKKIKAFLFYFFGYFGTCILLVGQLIGEEGGIIILLSSYGASLFFALLCTYGGDFVRLLKSDSPAITIILLLGLLFSFLMWLIYIITGVSILGISLFIALVSVFAFVLGFSFFYAYPDTSSRIINNIGDIKNLHIKESFYSLESTSLEIINTRNLYHHEKYIPLNKMRFLYLFSIVVSAPRKILLYCLFLLLSGSLIYVQDLGILEDALMVALVIIPLFRYSIFFLGNLKNMVFLSHTPNYFYKYKNKIIFFQK